jgi:diguanylate cyclase (GGDEF)-like protein
MDLESRLCELLSDFARTMSYDLPTQSILDHLVTRIVDVLPVSAAGVTLISSPTDPGIVAGSDESALRFEQLQTELGEGPGLATYETGAAVSVPDLRRDGRFPRFGPKARDLGLAAVFTVPLRRGADQLGSLDLYRTTPGGLSKKTMAAAQTLADVATAYLLNAQARAEFENASERARIESLHDALTGLPNRSLLIERLEHAILRCRRSGRLVAILYADLDGFKSINDTYGHQTGDELLVAVAERMTGLLRPGDTLARMSGDEFVVLCEDLDNVSQVEPIVSRIAHALARTFDVSGTQAHVSASVGIAFAGGGDKIPEQVLREADTAMYQAKRKGGGHHAFIDLREQRKAQNRRDLARDLRSALPVQLHLAYQPIVATASSAVIGVEALLRWAHPTLGPVPPQTAVELAEEVGLINEIGRWALTQACHDRRLWSGIDGNDGLGVSVNVSAHQLLAPDFVRTVEAVLTETGTAAEQLTLELTENVVIADTEGVLAVLHELKGMGVLLAVDDFGTGYSSLSYLTRLPVDVLKIDQAFIAALDNDPRNYVIASAIVELAHALQMSVVAEGVESSAQYGQVSELGCDAYQGFYFDRPMRALDLVSSLSVGVGAC